MKKKEIVVVAIIALIAIGTFAFMKLSQPQGSGITVAIQHRNTIVETFDPSIDATYHITGDYGELDVEVKDGKWHVTNEECPNHVCSNMGWVDENEIIPITCLPNNVMVYVMEKPE